MQKIALSGKQRLAHSGNRRHGRRTATALLSANCGVHIHAFVRHPYFAIFGECEDHIQMPGDLGDGAVIIPTHTLDDAGLACHTIKRTAVQQMPAKAIGQHVANRPFARTGGTIDGNDRGARHMR